MTNDLKKCWNALKSKQTQTKKLGKYYAGDHPIAFQNDKLAEVFKRNVVFKKNFCQVIVNTSRDRLKVQEWNHEDSGTSERMADIWKRVFLRPATNVHISALIHAEAYLMIWPDPNTAQTKAFYHSPAQAHVLYEEGDPYTPRVGVKIWDDSEGNPYLNLYYSDRIEHYKSGKDPQEHTAFKLIGEDPNPYGRIPLFHFQLSTPELTTGVISLQDALNKLLNDMMVTSEYSAFNQRWAIGNFEEGALPIGPGTTMKIPPGVEGEQSSSTGVYPASSPANYLEAIGALTNDMAALSGTPKHYFEGQGANISGEALHAMEGPLVNKIELFQQDLGITWADAMAFALELDGITAEPHDIEVIWKDAHTQQPQAQAQTRLTNTQAGIPIKNILRDEGWTQDQLDQLDEDAGQATQPDAAQGTSQTPRPGPPLTPEQAQPRFEGVVNTPDIAGEIARSGMLSRALNRRQASN